MKFRHLLIGLLLLLVTPIFAQDAPTSTLSDEELALVEEIQALYTSIKTWDAIGIEIVQDLEQHISFQGEEITQVIQSIMNTDTRIVDGVADAFTADTYQSINSDPLMGVLGMSIIYVDGELYLNITTGEGIYEGIFEEGWTIPANDPILSEMLGEMDIQALTEFEMQFGAELVESVAVTNVPEDVENAERAVTLVLYPEALQQQGFAGEIASGLFGESNDEMEALIMTLLDNATLELTYYMDADGQLLRVDMLMEVEGDFGELIGAEGFILKQQLNQVATYRYYDEPLVITAPEIE
jgi:hypothetical protein